MLRVSNAYVYVYVYVKVYLFVYAHVHVHVYVYAYVCRCARLRMRAPLTGSDRLCSCVVRARPSCHEFEAPFRVPPRGPIFG